MKGYISRVITTVLVAISSCIVVLSNSSLPANAQAACAPIDVVLVMDTTSSMIGAIDNVKAAALGIVDQIVASSGGDYQMGLVEFRDNVEVLVDLAPGTAAAVTSKIALLAASGGNGGAEASDEALNTVINNLSASGRPQSGNFSGTWRSSANKIIVLITDAPPAGFDDAYTSGIDDVNANVRAQEAKAKAIKISAIYVPTYGAVATAGSSEINTPQATDDVVTESIMRNYWKVTNGGYIKTAPNGMGTALAIRLTIEACGSPGEISTDPGVAPVPVPEPITIILFGTGLAGMAGVGLRKKRMK